MAAKQLMPPTVADNVGAEPGMRFGAVRGHGRGGAPRPRRSPLTSSMTHVPEGQQSRYAGGDDRHGGGSAPGRCRTADGSQWDRAADRVPARRPWALGLPRSTGHGGPFTIEQAVDDLDQVRAALGFARWAVAGHSWGAELALRYAARHQDRITAVAYIGGVGAGNGYRDAHVAELNRRLGPDRGRWAALSAIPAGDRTPAEERELCLLQWRTDFSPAPDAAAGQALALWETRPPGASVNTAANRGLWNDRATEDLLLAAVRVTCPVTMIFGEDDPRPWTASDSLLAALPDASRTVLEDAGHAPWAERPAGTRSLIIDALRPGACSRLTF
jgi:proline iminopeptidase